MAFAANGASETTTIGTESDPGVLRISAAVKPATRGMASCAPATTGDGGRSPRAPLPHPDQDHPAGSGLEVREIAEGSAEGRGMDLDGLDLVPRGGVV